MLHKINIHQSIAVHILKNAFVVFNCLVRNENEKLPFITKPVFSPNCKQVCLFRAENLFGIL
jgi:hypothetical protein